MSDTSFPPLPDEALPTAPQPVAGRLSERAIWTWPLLLMLVSLSVTAVVWLLAERSIDVRVQAQLAAEADDTAQSLHRGLLSRAQLVRAFAGLMSANPNLDAAQYAAFFHQVVPAEQLPQIASVGYALLVPQTQVEHHVQGMRKRGAAAYRIHPVGVRDAYAPVVLYQPVNTGNRNLLGFDPFGWADERASMERARDSGEVALSNKITLVQDRDNPVTAFVLHAPVFQPGTPTATVEERRRNTAGWINSALRVPELIGNLYPKGFDGFDLEIYDGDRVHVDALLFASAVVPRMLHAEPRRAMLRRVVAFGGRHWTLVFHARPGSVTDTTHQQAWYVAAIGALVSVVLALIASMMLRRMQRHQVQAIQTTLSDLRRDVETERLQLERWVDQRRRKERDALREAQRAIKELAIHKLALEEHAVVAVVDAHGCFTYVNDKYCQLCGYPRDELIGQPHTIVSSDHHPPEFYEAMNVAVRRGEVWHGEVCNRHRSGALFWVSSTVVPILGEAGSPSEYLVLLADITQRKNAEQELDRYRRRLEELVQQKTQELQGAMDVAIAANRAKTDFLANMSHEIRTPMNGIIGVIDILQHTGLSLAQRRMVDIVHDSAQALLRILNDLLDFSKIEAGKLELEHAPLSLRDALEGVALLLLPTATVKDIGIKVFVNPALPSWVEGDATRLRQILLNVAGNAVKFTSSSPDRTGMVVLRADPGDDGRCVRLTVQDNGIGMDPTMLQRLFQPFTQADESTARRFGGTGLGLSITHKLVELMSGHIQVHSTLGEGSRFQIDLPLSATDPPPNHQSIDPRLDGLRVMVVSARAAEMEIVPSYCRSAGADVVLAEGVEHAKRLLQGEGMRTDALVLGLSISGTKLDYGWDPSLPVVRLVRRRLDQQPDPHAVLARPLIYLDLISALARACGRQLPATGPGLPTKDLVVVASPDAEAAVQQRRLILVAEDNETNRDVLHEQLRLLGYAAEVAHDGARALHLWRNGLVSHSGLGRYALLITDCQMPGLDGFELSRRIRASEPPGTHLPIIAITANAMQGDAQRCLDAGMDAHLGKPLRMHELADTLGRWLPPLPGTAKKPDARSPADAARHADEPTEPVWDGEALTRAVGQNPALHARLLERFLVNARMQVEQIRQAASGGTPADAALAAHTLKSAARSVGAMQLGALCARLEAVARGDSDTDSMALADGLPAALHAVERIIAARQADAP